MLHQNKNNNNHDNNDDGDKTQIHACRLKIPVIKWPLFVHWTKGSEWLYRITLHEMRTNTEKYPMLIFRANYFFVFMLKKRV